MDTKKEPWVLVTDFDGTITETDFFYHMIEKVLSQEDIQPWSDYQAGKMTHFEALNKIFKKIHLTKEEFLEVIYTIPIEEGFVNTLQYCSDNNIKIYVVSSGADYYIKLILENLGLKDRINIIANKSVYSPESGLNMLKMREDWVFYSNNYGVDKGLVVKFLKNKYEKVIFAGDGVPDYDAAKHADVVFARRELEKVCEENHLPYHQLDSYFNILEYLKMHT